MVKRRAAAGADSDADSTQTTAFGDLTDYPDGAILKIIFHNFLTYDHAVCVPGPRLNVIVGTNGSGKSTIICGICLALGGAPKSLGRSERIADYVKHGKEDGYVEMHLNDTKKGTQILKVAIKKPAATSYYVNGTHVTLTALKEVVTSYNIQVDNLCTFLAQDKVKSFSEQSAVELLENTLKAADSKLLETRVELIEKQKNEEQMDKRVSEAKKQLGQLESQIQTLEPRVENFKKKKAMKKRIALLTKRKAIMGFNAMHAAFERENAVLETKKKEADDALKEVKEAQKKEEELAKNRSSYAAKRDDARLRIRNKEYEMQLIQQQCTFKVQLESLKTEYKRSITRTKNWDKEVANLREEVNKKQKQLEEAREELEGHEEAQHVYNEAIAKLNGEEMRLSSSDANNRSARQALDGEFEKLAQRGSHSKLWDDQRMELLRSRFPKTRTFEAWHWYLRNKDQFKEPVYCPILHIQLKNPEDNIYLENLIAFRDYPMFIFGNKRDETMFTEKFSVATTVITQAEASRQYNTPFNDEFKQYGFRCMASDLFQAPAPVKAFLCNTVYLHTVPIGTAKTNDDIDGASRMLQKYNIRVFQTTTNRIHVTVSRYSNEVITNVGQLKNWNLLVRHNVQSFAVDTTTAERELIAKRNRLLDEKKDIEASYRSLDQKKAEAKREIAVFRGAKERAETLAGHLKAAKHRYDAEMATRPDIDSATAAYKRGSEDLLHAELDRVEKMTKIVVDRNKCIHAIFIISVAIESIGHRGIDLENARRDAIDKWEELKRAVELCDNDIKDLRRKRNLALEVLKVETGFATTTEADMPTDDKKKWRQLQQEFVADAIPDKLDELHQEMNTEKGRIQLVSNDATEQDVERLEQLKAAFNSMLKKVNEQGQSKEQRKEELEAEIDAWLAPVRDIISRICVNYVAFFDRLGCNGEVHLEEPENKMDVNKYGIMIMVRFRAGEKLRRLDGQVQSGGERSVSTMLYLLALQEECPVPFRCVDEINQGMDPTNERRVFDVMVDKLSTGHGALGKSQYFLLTPKLLHGLKFTPAVTVQIVHNGPTLDKNASEWDPARFLAIMRSRALTTRNGS